MGTARDDFEKRKSAEIKVFDVATQIAVLFEGLSKADQRRVMEMIDDRFKITPPREPDYFPYNH